MLTLRIGREIETDPASCRFSWITGSWKWPCLVVYEEAEISQPQRSIRTRTEESSRRNKRKIKWLKLQANISKLAKRKRSKKENEY